MIFTWVLPACWPKNRRPQETCYITLLKVLNNILEHPAEAALGSEFRDFRDFGGPFPLPSEAKFRHLKTSNAALRAKAGSSLRPFEPSALFGLSLSVPFFLFLWQVFDLPGAKEFFLSCGFTEEEGGEVLASRLIFFVLV